MPQDGGGDPPMQQSPLSDTLKDLLKFCEAFTQFVNEPRFGQNDPKMAQDGHKMA